MTFIRDNMPALMFGAMIFFMMTGYPAAFCLAATGLFFAFIGIELGMIVPNFLGNLTYQLFGIISNDLLLAIPFFTFMGAILERCGLAEDLLDSFGQLFESKSRYIRNFAKEKKPSVIAFGWTSHRL